MANRKKSNVLDDRNAAVGTANDGGAQSEAPPTGFYLDDQGRVCYGQECLLIRETPDGLEFELDPATCSPETRDKLLAAALRGSNLKLRRHRGE